VDRGYANRWYARALNENRERLRRQRKDRGESQRSHRSFPKETPASIDANRAEHAQALRVRHLIKSSIRYGSIEADDNSGLRVRRPLAATQGLTKEQIVANPDETRADIAERELLRALRPLRDKLGTPYYRVPKDVQVQIQRWLDLKLIHRP